MDRMTCTWSLLFALGVGFLGLPCEAAKRRFTVADDIGVSHFGDIHTGRADPITFSPNGRYFVVDTERGLVEENRPQSTLRVYRTEDVHQFLLHPNTMREPSPMWIFSKSTYKDGPIITSICWLADSSGLAFLVKSSVGNDQLFLGDLKTKTLQALTPGDQQVTAFSICDRNHYVYSVQSPDIMERLTRENQAASIVGTGRSFHELVFPTFMRSIYDLSELRAVIDGKHFLVRDKSSGSPVRLYYLGQQALMLAPDGRSVITALAVDPVPQEWETLYRPSNPTDAVHRIAAGHQNLDAFAGYNYVSEYVLIDLTSGKVSQLTDAPIGFAAGWSSFPSHPDWSRDGRAVVLSNTFVRANPQGLGGQQNPPCIAVVELLENRVNCVERLHGETNTNDGHEIAHHVVRDARFVRGDNQRVRIDYWAADASEGSITYGQSSDGSWTALDKANGWPTQNALIALNVKESFTDPPVLIATDKGTNTSRAIFDPNPQLRDIDLGEASVFTWKDKHDRDWNGGLYKPPGYVSGRRYPLVIQTHGFTQFKFVPSGVFPTAFAARELASAGILVLQVPDCPILNTPEEGSCNVAVYEAAVEQLVAAGLVDPERVGIIGFSRSCYYVLEALTNSTLHLKAASITDGINVGYMEYMMGVDYVGNLMAHTADAIIGAPPFREGLQRWLKRSPDLNMDKVVTPLLVVENGFAKVIQMWEPYAALRYLNRPVDLILLNSDEHILTNPGVRMASQGGTVDWFRFWLNGEEDSDPKKAEQYVRWRELRKLQAENDVKEKAAKETTPVN